MLKITEFAIVAALIMAPITVRAESNEEGIENFFAVVERGASEGGAALGPVGVIIGGAVGGVKGVLGIKQRSAYYPDPVLEHRSVYSHNRHSRFLSLNGRK
jgi:hypothetical protein